MFTTHVCERDLMLGDNYTIFSYRKKILTNIDRVTGVIFPFCGQPM